MRKTTKHFTIAVMMMLLVGCSMGGSVEPMSREEYEDFHLDSNAEIVDNFVYVLETIGDEHNMPQNEARKNKTKESIGNIKTIQDDVENLDIDSVPFVYRESHELLVEAVGFYGETVEIYLRSITRDGISDDNFHTLMNYSNEAIDIRRASVNAFLDELYE